MDDLNPYAAPQSDVLRQDEDAMRIRQEHLRTEAHLKALGIFWMTANILGGLSTYLMNQAKGADFGVHFPISTERLILCAAGIISGTGLFWLKPFAKWLTILLSVIALGNGLMQLPSGIGGAAIQVFIVRFLLLQKTRRVLAQDYADILRQTTALRSRPAGWIWIILAVITISVLVMAL
jgi:hypothetical protein